MFHYKNQSQNDAQRKSSIYDDMILGLKKVKLKNLSFYKISINRVSLQKQSKNDAETSH